MPLQRTLALLVFCGYLNAAHADFAEGVEAAARGDFKAALEHWQPLAEQGDASAQFNLGLMYFAGQGVPRNHQEAARWFRLAAEQGDAKAQFNLGVMCAEGQGVPRDYAAAASWFRLAAGQGHAEAQFNLGLLYGEGRGVVQNSVVAYALANHAAMAGYANAAKYRAFIAQKMPQNDILAGQDLTFLMGNDPLQAIDAYLAGKH